MGSGCAGDGAGEHRHCSLLVPLKVHFISDLDTEHPQTCLGAMRGCWCWAGCCFLGVVGNNTNPGQLWDQLYIANPCILGNLSGLDWTIPDFKKQSMTHSLQQVSTSCKPREAEMGFYLVFIPLLALGPVSFPNEPQQPHGPCW